MHTVKTRIRNAGRHHRLAIDLPGVPDIATAPLAPAAITDIESAGQLAPDSEPLYSLPDALAAFQAGKYELDVEPEFIGGNNPRPSGGLWLFAVPHRSKKAPKRHQAFLQVVHDVSNRCLKLKIPAQTRAGNLATVLAAKKRNKEVEKAQSRAKSNPAVTVPDQIEVPPLPAGVTDLDIKLEIKNDLFAKIHVLLPLGGHRFLFIEPPGAPSINRRMVWEAWLLYPNFPETFLKDPKSADVPVENSHYRVLIRHEDPSKGSCGGCCGAEGKGGRAQVQWDLIKSLATTPPPAAPGNQAGGFPQVSEAELMLTVLAFVAQMNAMVASRKGRMISLPFTAVSGIMAVVVLVLKFSVLAR